MQSEIATGLLLSSLAALSCLPIVRIQLILLRILRGMITVGVLGVLGVAALAVIRPEWITELARHIVPGSGTELSNLGPMEWASLSLVVTLTAALPLAIVDFAIRVTILTTTTTKLLRAVETGDRERSTTVPRSTPAVTLDDAVRAISVATRSASSVGRRRRIGDLVDEGH